MKSSILVVDDTPNNLTLLVNLLSENAYTVRAAKDGPAALRSAFSNPPDLVLLDIFMPDMDGYEVCRQLKEDERTCDIPVIFISALDDTENITHAFAVGGVDYVTKPFQPAEVLARVKNHLTLVKQRRELIRQREEIAQRHAQERQQFEIINQMRERFIYAATHDLKNPLALITGYVSLLENEEAIASHEGVQTYLNGIQNGTRKMLVLIQDMLDLMQLESTLHLSIVGVDLNEFVGRVVDSYQMLAQQSQIILVYVPLFEPVTVHLDPQRIERVLENLISNAIKYTAEGGKVEVKCIMQAGRVDIHIKDTGMGIPAAALPYLFEPFYRVSTKNHQNIEGNGLGLSIARSIVDQHGGQIYVNSKAGRGSTFTVSLPLNGV